MKNEDMINSIEEYWRPSDERCGRLIQKQGWVTHYSVALSSHTAMAWGGVELGSKGCLVTHDIGPEFSDTQWVMHLPLDDIKRNLLGSVAAFHNETWLYSLIGWNCEHWARLVTTGEPICYQVRDFFPFNIFIGGQHWRGEAIPHLAAHVGILANSDKGFQKGRPSG